MQDITSSLCKTIHSLDQTKRRTELGIFKAEGTKCVLDTLGHFTHRCLVATRQWYDENPGIERTLPPESLYCAPRGSMGRISSLKTPPQVVAVYEIPDRSGIVIKGLADSNLVLALDTIQDPGNLGTIVRVADWMGVDTILASRETADIFSPKTVQATMGAIARVKVIYGDLPAMIAEADAPEVYGTYLNGENINDARLSPAGIIITGNEGNGISEAVGATVTRRLTIPSYPPGRQTSESLNAAIATAITLAMFRR